MTKETTRRKLLDLSERDIMACHVLQAYQEESGNFTGEPDLEWFYGEWIIALYEKLDFVTTALLGVSRDLPQKPASFLLEKEEKP